MLSTLWKTGTRSWFSQANKEFCSLNPFGRTKFERERKNREISCGCSQMTPSWKLPIRFLLAFNQHWSSTWLPYPQFVQPRPELKSEKMALESPRQHCQQIVMDLLRKFEVPILHLQFQQIALILFLSMVCLQVFTSVLGGDRRDRAKLLRAWWRHSWRQVLESFHARGTLDVTRN